MTAIISMLIFVHRKIAIIKVIIILLHGGTRVMSSQYAHNPNWTVPCRWTHEKSPQTGTYLFPAALLHRFVLTWSYLVFQLYFNIWMQQLAELVNCFFLCYHLRKSTFLQNWQTIYYVAVTSPYCGCGRRGRKQSD